MNSRTGEFHLSSSPPTVGFSTFWFGGWKALCEMYVEISVAAARLRDIVSIEKRLRMNMFGSERALYCKI